MHNKKQKQWLINKLRKASYMWAERNLAVTMARVERGWYKCATCDERFKRDQIQVDHIQPVVKLKGWTDWDDYINRLFCEEHSGYQILCKPCHIKKTALENHQRDRGKKS